MKMEQWTAEELDRRADRIGELEAENSKLRAQIDTAVNTSNGLLDRCVALQKENDRLKAALENYRDMGREAGR